MFRRLLILDAGLIALLAIGVMRLREDARAFRLTHDVSAVQPKPESFPGLQEPTVQDVSGAANWTDIPSRNPFSFDRSDVDIVAAPPAPLPPKPLGPRPVLFGTLLIGTDRLALIGAGPTGNGARRTRAGESIDGWTIVEIDPQSIQIESNGFRQTVIMNDPTAQTPRDYGRTATSAGATPSIPAAQAAAPATAQPAPAVSGGNTTPAPAAGQRKTRVVQTIFGPRTIEDIEP